MIQLVSAVSLNGGIGYKNQLLFHYKDDLLHFKKITFGTVLVMGRKTFESLPGTLPKREHAVLTTSKIHQAGVKTFSSVDDILQHYLGKDISVIGGESVYREFAQHADRASISHILHSATADTFFPMEVLKLFPIIEDLGYIADNNIRLITYLSDKYKDNVGNLSNGSGRNTTS
jgi:dihydrofolate reductase